MVKNGRVSSQVSHSLQFSHSTIGNGDPRHFQKQFLQFTKFISNNRELMAGYGGYLVLFETIDISYIDNTGPVRSEKHFR
jgi:hypothetical protein